MSSFFENKVIVSRTELLCRWLRLLLEFRPTHKELFLRFLGRVQVSCFVKTSLKFQILESKTISDLNNQMLVPFMCKDCQESNGSVLNRTKVFRNLSIKLCTCPCLSLLLRRDQR